MSKVFLVLKEIVDIFMKYPVFRSAAALSYYLTLSIFPFIICISVILGSFNIQDSNTFGLLEAVIPLAAYSILFDYLNYISDNRSQLMFIIALAAMLTSSSAAFRSFTSIMGEIQGKMRFIGILKWLVSFVFSLLFLGAIYGSALVMLSGDWLLQFLNENFELSAITVIWTWVRFLILFLLLFSVVYSIYLISAPRKSTRMSRFPGALIAAIILVTMSMLFSQLVTASMRYEILYGSLASFIVLMVWLYTCALIFIMANVLNISISKIREAGNSD